MSDYQYYEMMDDDEVYAVCRTQGALVERWSPDRQQWKEALFHVGDLLFNGSTSERRQVDEAEAEKTIAEDPLRDLTDSEWAELTNSKSDAQV